MQRGALAVIGLVAIAYACGWYDSGTRSPARPPSYPSSGRRWCCWPAQAVTRREPLPIRALGVPPMRVVGDWSYSLYLWHWPVLIIPERAGGPGLSVPFTIFVVVLIFVLSASDVPVRGEPFRSPVRLPRRRALSLYPRQCCWSSPPA